MRSLAAVLAAALALALAGCASHAKPLAAAPPAPLSSPQTQVVLPPPQPLNPDALPAEVAAVPASQPPARRPATTVQPPVERPAVQALLPAQEQKRLRDSAQARKQEVRAALAKMSGRALSAADRDLIKRIEFFLSQSDQAERRGDMSQADAFAQRAQDLARGWQNGQ
jgi:type IV secretory pathway VirB10-like protein